MAVVAAAAAAATEVYKGRVAVIGVPGHGKSTVLNGIANSPKGDDEEDEEVFKSGATGASVTQTVSHHVVRLVDKETRAVRCDLDLIDTMGWPDNDPNKAAKFYDSVVNEAVNHPDGLNALIWIVKPERFVDELTRKYKVFMAEFSQAKSPIIVVINGTANYGTKLAKNPANLLKRREKDALELNEFAKELCHNCDFHATKIIVSTDMSYITDGLVDDLVDVMDKYCSRKWRNNVRTWPLIKIAYTDAATAYKTHMSNLQATVDKLRAEVDSQKQRIATQKEAAESAVAAVKEECGEIAASIFAARDARAEQGERDQAGFQTKYREKASSAGSVARAAQVEKGERDQAGVQTKYREVASRAGVAAGNTQDAWSPSNPFGFTNAFGSVIGRDYVKEARDAAYEKAMRPADEECGKIRLTSAADAERARDEAYEKTMRIADEECGKIKLTIAADDQRARDEVYEKETLADEECGLIRQSLAADIAAKEEEIEEISSKLSTAGAAGKKVGDVLQSEAKILRDQVEALSLYLEKNKVTAPT